MPLHLLGKKSWNVYNEDNVSRVRRDEADARAREEAAEQRMQEQDAARRMALLRGEEPPPALPEPDEDSLDRRRGDDVGGASRGHKRRRLKGEDDTDREMRYAREDAEAGERVREGMRERSGKGDDRPLQDGTGHIQLFSAPEERGKGRTKESKEEREQRRKKEQEEQQQQGMRFTDAAGYRSGSNKPWYTASDVRHDESRQANELMLADIQGKDVWGNEDPRRKEREQNRIVSNDPFAMMQRAQKQLKQSEGDREKWKRERDQELQELKREDERKQRRERKHDRRSSRRDELEDEGLESFSLDSSAREPRSRRNDHDRHRRHHHSRSHRHRRDRSRSRSRDRERR